MAFPIYFPKRRSERGDTAAVLAAANEVLLPKEWCIETDTGRMKRGDGVTAYNSLPYAVAGDIDLSDLADGDALVWDATAGQWSPVAPAGDVAGDTHAATSKTTPVDADEIPLADSAASFGLKKLTWGNLKATLKTYFDTLYQAIHANLTALSGLTGAADKVPYFTGAGAMALATMTSAARSLLDDVDAAAMRATLGITAAGTFDYTLNSTFMEEFRGSPPITVGNVTTAGTTWALANLSTGCSLTSVDGGSSHPGVWRLNSGTTSTGICSVSLGAVNNVSLGGGSLTREYLVRFPTISDATNRFVMILGWRDAWGSGPTQRLEALYTDNVNSGKLIIRALSGGVTTDANGVTALSANVFYRIKLVANAAGTQVDLYLAAPNSAYTLEATLSSGIPQGPMMDGFGIFKSAGASPRNLDIDLFKIDDVLTTAR